MSRKKHSHPSTDLSIILLGIAVIVLAIAVTFIGTAITKMPRWVCHYEYETITIDNARYNCFDNANLVDY